MSRPQRHRGIKWEPIAGVVAGLLVWAYDNHMFLNPAGSAAPISQAIRVATNFQNSGALVYVYWPPFVLASVGGVIGFAASLLRMD